MICVSKKDLLSLILILEKAHFILDEVIIAGELQDTSKVVPLVEVRMADAMIPNAEKIAIKRSKFNTMRP